MNMPAPSTPSSSSPSTSTRGSATRRALVAAVRTLLDDRARMLRRNMDEAQEEANSHQGAMASRYDTFKEEAQDRKNGYAVELQKTLDLLARLPDVRLGARDEVAFGALVATRDARGTVTRYFFFAAVASTPLVVDGVPHYAVSLLSPIGKVLAGRRAGEEVTFRGQRLHVVEVA